MQIKPVGNWGLPDHQCIAGGSACAKPDLIPRITSRLMEVDKTHFDPSRQGLINWYVVESTDQYIHLVEDKTKILQFVEGLSHSSHARLQKHAQNFLKKWKI